jgi:predicted aldo/keto reductase-like oxidoreductase
VTTKFTIDGKKVSLLGYGAMRLPALSDGKSTEPSARNSGNIDQKKFNEHVKYMLDNGINYFDTSPAYCKGKSEASLGIALKASGYSRDSYVIATKMSNFAPSQYPLEVCKKMFYDSLKNLQTDYIDNYLLHYIGKGGFKTFLKRYIDNGALEWCIELRKKGLIRNLGFSFHGDLKTFEWCLENHDKYKWDFCLIQMNYVDWKHASEFGSFNTNAEYLYNRLTACKIPVAVMEPLLGGRLAQYNYATSKILTPYDPEATPAKWAFRFCASYPNVMTILSGMSKMEHIEENIETFSPVKPCTKEELEALEAAAVAYLKQKTIPCNKCNYCMPCPYGLDIPGLLTFRNEILIAQTPPSPKEMLKLYEKAVPEKFRRADHCTGCAKCNPHCPQAIDVPKEIEKIALWMDALRDMEMR